MVSFALSKPKASTSAAPPPSLKRPAAFAFGDDDEPIDAAPTASSSLDKSTAANKKLLAQNVQSSKAMQKRMAAEKRVDNTVYEYDEVWDKMQEAKLRQKEAKEVESKDRKPKYISGLLQSAATRRLDYLRAEEKLMQREREAEGDEFADKDSFVTQAYKDQMAAVRAAEEEEKKRDEALKKKGGATSGMAHFYQRLLQESEEKHDATVAATQQPVIGPQPNLTITRPPDLTPVSDLELATKAREEGKQVELNDDNQIVDKRDLLVAGLNLSAPNTRRLGGVGSNAGKDKNTEEAHAHRAVGTAASRREINERRTREIQQQMEAEQERLEGERERAEHEAIQRIAVKRNDETAVQSARERYLERKRQKLESEAAD